MHWAGRAFGFLQVFLLVFACFLFASAAFPYYMFFFVPPLLMGGCEVHTMRVGMASALLAESTQPNRVSGVRRRSRVRSCKTDARMLVASTLVGKISLTPRFARRCRYLRHAHARREMTMTFGETISHERSRSNRVCRTEPPYSQGTRIRGGYRPYYV